MTNGCVLTDAGRYRTAIKLAFFLMFLTSVIIFDRGGLYFQCGHTTLKDIPHQFVCQVRSKAQKNCGEINWKIILDVDLPWEQILSSTITSPIPLPLVNLRKRTRPVQCWANLHHHNWRQCYPAYSFWLWNCHVNMSLQHTILWVVDEEFLLSANNNRTTAQIVCHPLKALLERH